MRTTITLLLLMLNLALCPAKNKMDEICLWGVNFQPCLSWEYNSRLKNAGVELTDLHQVVDRNLEELTKMKVNMIRCHLTPADFTDDAGNLVETPFLDALDYMIAQAEKKGIKTTLAFINHMGNSYLRSSFMNQLKREDWIHLEKARKCSQNYIAQLLGRRNPYSSKTYAKDDAIAYWELINEPALYSWKGIQNEEAAWSEFGKWLSKHKLTADKEVYAQYRKELVQDYIDGMCRLIRRKGSAHPVVWSHNWHRYRNGNLDIFEAALASKVDAVACCNYPGQDYVPEDYWNAPVDMATRDFAPWFNQYFDDVNGYGWMRLPEYSQKAKIVYEFETFYNQSSYLYPIQALYFRALGVQGASMWTYCMQEYAPYHSGSHFLSLTCTPRKAVSFIIARQIFQNTPLGAEYDRAVNELVSEHYAISRERDLAVWSDEHSLYHTRDIKGDCPLSISPKVQEIIAVGSSDLVSYSGTGIYIIQIHEDSISLELMPNHKWIQDPWNGKARGLVTELDYNTAQSLSLRLDSWGEGSYILSKLEGDEQKNLCELDSLENILLQPGKYIISKHTKINNY